METTIEELVTELNQALKKTDLTREKAVALINIAKDELYVHLKVLDFSFYNKSTRIKARNEKINAVRSGNFEYAAEKRDLERRCEKYIELKKQLDIKASSFYYEDGDLYYLCLGDACNDQLFSRLLIGFRIDQMI